MSSQSIVFAYLQSCTSGKLGLAECGPMWQLLVIAVLLLGAIVALLVLRLRSRPQVEKA